MEGKTTKMVIVIRNDLKNIKGEKVRSGKIAAQVAHSTLGFIWNHLDERKICFELSDEQYQWVTTGETKICLKVDSERELMEVFQAAKTAGLDVRLVIDSGLTEFDGPTKTCICIGPHYSEKIDSITGRLSLY